jgi:NADH dehydrogenase
VVEHSLSFRTLADVQRLQQLIATLRQRQRPLQRLAVVGGGASGVELACKLADELGDAALVELLERGPTLLPQARSFNREQALLALQRRDVRVRTGTAVVAVAADHLLIGPQAQRLACDGVIWTAGIRCQPPAINPAPQTDGSGRLHTGSDLRVNGCSDLFAIGDGAHCDDGTGQPLPANAQVAFQQATCLADNLLRAAAGEPLRPFSFQDLGEMMSLGRQEACLTGAGVTLAGRAAYELRRLAYLTRMPGGSHRLKVAAGWMAAWS